MVEVVSPIQFARASSQGRTKPSLLVCEKLDGEPVEVIAKFSEGCDEREANLAREIIAARLAADLHLPIPEPFVIDLRGCEDWIGSIPDAERRATIQTSSRMAFGSKFLVGQYSVWNSSIIISEEMLGTAAAIFAFDAIIQNIDRRDINPNCLVKGSQVRIFDHEMAFQHRYMLGWQPPWIAGGLKHLETPGLHIFRAGLKGRLVNLDQIKTAWMQISDATVDSYGVEIPELWAQPASASIMSALSLIKDARNNIDACLTEIARVLT